MIALYYRSGMMPVKLLPEANFHNQITNALKTLASNGKPERLLATIV